MLTTAQYQTLKTAALADGTAAGYIETANDQALANWFNTPDAAYYVWRTAIQPSEYREAVVWTEVDALTVGKARIWEWITQIMTMPIDASKTNVRQGIADCWASNTTTRANLLTAAKRNATRAEKLLATGAGTSGSPSVMGYEGNLSAAEASLVRVA